MEALGKPLYPIKRHWREAYNYEKQSPSEHLKLLEKFLEIAPEITPQDEETLNRPVLSHPDLSPSNIFVSDDYEITTLIDWQHSCIMPLFLHCTIPTSLQNYGDDVSEAKEVPLPPSGSDDLSEQERAEQAEMYRRRHVHYVYMTDTEKRNPLRFRALQYPFNTLRSKLSVRSGEPWAGESVTFKADLIRATQSWPPLTANGEGLFRPCPIEFTDDEIAKCLKLDEEQKDADQDFEGLCEAAGASAPDGWMPVEHFDRSREVQAEMKEVALQQADSDEERAQMTQHWIFDDFDEEEYS